MPAGNGQVMTVPTNAVLQELEDQGPVVLMADASPSGPEDEPRLETHDGPQEVTDAAREELEYPADEGDEG